MDSSSFDMLSMGPFLTDIRRAASLSELSGIMTAATHELGFRYFGLFHHANPRTAGQSIVHVASYPEAVVDHLLERDSFRHDPIVRACRFAGCAFRWSDINQVINLNSKDRLAFAYVAREGLDDGVTVPFHRLGDPPGSCTFVGSLYTDATIKAYGAAQLIGSLAFSCAARMVGQRAAAPATLQQLPPRHRECVVLVGRGYSTKRIARAMGITPRTVDGYLTETRQFFQVCDRASLVAEATLAGEIDLYELKRRQPE